MQCNAISLTLTQSRSLTHTRTNTRRHFYLMHSISGLMLFDMLVVLFDVEPLYGEPLYVTILANSGAIELY